jgi:hypothetical protein
MALRLSLDILGGLLAAWFWPHCAKPSLTALRAASAAHRIVLGITGLTVVGCALAAVADIARIYGGTRWWITLGVGALWIFVVGLGYLQDFKLLRRATGHHPHVSPPT